MTAAAGHCNWAALGLEESSRYVQTTTGWCSKTIALDGHAPIHAVQDNRNGQQQSCWCVRHGSDPAPQTMDMHEVHAVRWSVNLWRPKSTPCGALIGSGQTVAVSLHQRLPFHASQCHIHAPAAACCAAISAGQRALPRGPCLCAKAPSDVEMKLTCESSSDIAS